MKKSKFLAVCFLAFSMLAAGCGSSRSNVAADSPDVHNFQKSEAIEASVYLDGTVSMYGYVNYPGGTIYDEAVKNVDRSLASTWKKETVDYVKFGDDMKTMNRNEFLQMDQTAFYDQKDTSLQKVVEQTDTKKLNIIVTDLFQTNQDLDSLVMALKSKCADENAALAIIGMKSQFNGKIFDVGKNLASFDYASNDTPQSYRPFYIMVFGQENDVRAFVVNYQQNAPANAQLRAVMFSKNLGAESKLSLDTTSTLDPADKKKGKLAQISTIANDSETLQYRLKLDEKESVDYIRMDSKDVIGKIPNQYEVKVDAIETTNSEDAPQASHGVVAKIKSMLPGGKKNTNSAFTPVRVNGFFAGNVTNTGLQAGIANVAVTVHFFPAEIQKKAGIYRVVWSLIPTKDAYLASVDAFADWNFNDSQIGPDPSAMADAGSKTLNISTFTKQLGNMNYEMHGPGFHYNNIYLDAK